MKIKDLHKYRVLTEELELVREHLNALEVHDVVLGDSGEPAHSKVPKQVDGYVYGKSTTDLLSKKNNIENEMLNIERTINCITTPRIRKALKLYCLSDSPMSWDMVADEMQEYSPDALRKAVERYLKDCDW